MISDFNSDFTIHKKCLKVSGEHMGRGEIIKYFMISDFNSDFTIHNKCLKVNSQEMPKSLHYNPRISM